MRKYQVVTNVRKFTLTARSPLEAMHLLLDKLSLTCAQNCRHKEPTKLSPHDCRQQLWSGAQSQLDEIAQKNGVTRAFSEALGVIEQYLQTNSKTTISKTMLKTFASGELVVVVTDIDETVAYCGYRHNKLQLPVTIDLIAALKKKLFWRLVESFGLTS